MRDGAANVEREKSCKTAVLYTHREPPAAPGPPRPPIVLYSLLDDDVLFGQAVRGRELLEHNKVS